MFHRNGRCERPCGTTWFLIINLITVYNFINTAWPSWLSWTSWTPRESRTPRTYRNVRDERTPRPPRTPRTTRTPRSTRNTSKLSFISLFQFLFHVNFLFHVKLIKALHQYERISLFFDPPMLVTFVMIVQNFNLLGQKNTGTWYLNTSLTWILS